MSHSSRPEGLRVPRSIAVIMDGNGRWAQRRGLERIKGHEHGATAVRETVEECGELGVEALTLYAFSSENWRRPRREVNLLMRLLRKFLRDRREELIEKDVRVVHAGRRERLPAAVLTALDETVAATAHGTGLLLCLAIDYGGRTEIVDAARALARSVVAGETSPEQITEEAMSAQMYRPELPAPDLLIRTAGERRVSNFLLWQISYAELYVTEVCWPEFRREHLWQALEDYQRRVRKFGAVVP